MRISDWSSDVCSSDLSAFPNSAGCAAAAPSRATTPRSCGKRCRPCRERRPLLPLSRRDDAVAHHLAGTEGEHAARRDRHLDAGLGIAADPFALVTQDEGAETRNLEVLAIGERAEHADRKSTRLNPSP